MKDFMDMKSLPKFGAVKKKVVRRKSTRKPIVRRKVKGRWFEKGDRWLPEGMKRGRPSKATSRSIRRKVQKELRDDEYRNKNQWVAVGNKEYYAEQDRRQRQSERDKARNDYRRSGYAND
jgi:hypothetical protein